MRREGRDSPLASAAIGTARNDLIRPCDTVLRASAPPMVDEGVPLALSFSGGGFRATLAALGVLRLVADAGLLGRVRYISSVSGGSIANGFVAHHFEELHAAGFTPESVDEVVIAPFVNRISTQSLSRTLLRNVWRTIGSKTRTHLLAEAFDAVFQRARA